MKKNLSKCTGTEIGMGHWTVLKKEGDPGHETNLIIGEVAPFPNYQQERANQELNMINR